MSQKTKVMVNGYTRHLNLKEGIQRSMAAGTYEPRQTAWVKETLRAGGRFVDVGASFGYYASLASQIVGPSGQVFAFEPSPIAHASLQEMISENNVTNITLCCAAVGDRVGDVEIFLPDDERLHSPSIFSCDQRFTPHRVPMVTIDSFKPLNDGHPIDLIKIDVEGFEPNVIEGMRSLIGRRVIRNMTCEFNSGWLRRNDGMTPAQLLKRILELGFKITAMTEKVVGKERGGVIPYELQDILFALPE